MTDAPLHAEQPPRRRGGPQGNTALEQGPRGDVRVARQLGDGDHHEHLHPCERALREVERQRHTDERRRARKLVPPHHDHEGRHRERGEPGEEEDRGAAGGGDGGEDGVARDVVGARGEDEDGEVVERGDGGGGHVHPEAEVDEAHDEDGEGEEEGGPGEDVQRGGPWPTLMSIGPMPGKFQREPQDGMRAAGVTDEGVGRRETTDSANADGDEILWAVPAPETWKPEARRAQFPPHRT
ncbi:hypothetical protein C8R43DRAFT_1845 [Mycena crocata]|nr:hypothetical protein C8R43DRAFT_1845 [Mycena crocata]